MQVLIQIDIIIWVYMILIANVSQVSDGFRGGATVVLAGAATPTEEKKNGGLNYIFKSIGVFL